MSDELSRNELILWLSLGLPIEYKLHISHKNWLKHPPNWPPADQPIANVIDQNRGVLFRKAPRES